MAQSAREFLRRPGVSPPIVLPLANPAFPDRIRGSWKPDTIYGAGDIATVSGRAWLALVAHLSGATFVPGSNWKLVADRGSAELGAAVLSADFVPGASGGVVTGLSYTITPETADPFYVEVYAPIVKNVTAAKVNFLQLIENGAPTVPNAQAFSPPGSLANAGGMIFVRYRKVPTPGVTLAYTVNYGVIGGGVNNVTVVAGTSLSIISA